jgi:flagellar protein FliJ
MSKGFRLKSVLRARQAQEDAARAEVVRARRAAADAADAAVKRGERLAAHQTPNEDTARAVVAALTARQAMAASLSAARQLHHLAEKHVTVRAEELTEAARRRRTVEKLAERHAEQRRQREQQAEQAALDELGTTSQQRDAAREIRP